MAWARSLCLVGVLIGCLALAGAENEKWSLKQCQTDSYYCPGTGQSKGKSIFRSPSTCTEIFHDESEKIYPLERVVYGYLANSLFSENTNSVEKDKCKAWYRTYISMQNAMNADRGVGLSDEEYSNLLSCVDRNNFEDLKRYLIGASVNTEELLNAVGKKMTDAIDGYSKKAYDQYSAFDLHSADRTKHYEPMEEAVRMISGIERQYLRSTAVANIVNMKAMCDKVSEDGCEDIARFKKKAEGWFNHMEEIRTTLNQWKKKFSTNAEEINAPEPTTKTKTTTFDCDEAVMTAAGFVSMLDSFKAFIDPPQEFSHGKATIDKLRDAIKLYQENESSFDNHPSNLMKLNRKGRKEAAERVASEIRAMNLESIVLGIEQIKQAGHHGEEEFAPDPTTDGGVVTTDGGVVEPPSATDGVGGDPLAVHDVVPIASQKDKPTPTTPENGADEEHEE